MYVNLKCVYIKLICQIYKEYVSIILLVDELNSKEKQEKSKAKYNFSRHYAEIPFSF